MVVSGIYLSMTIVYTYILSTGVIIQMMEIQKQVTEGGTVTVCASLTGQLGRNVEVRLATSSGGTGGEGNTLINYKFIGMLLFSLIYPY